jgi:hypothetical protein
MHSNAHFLQTFTILFYLHTKNKRLLNVSTSSVHSSKKQNYNVPKDMNISVSDIFPINIGVLPLNKRYTEYTPCTYDQKSHKKFMLNI